MASTLSFIDTPDHEAAAPVPSPCGILELPRSDDYQGENRRFLPRIPRRFQVVSESHGKMTGVDISFGGMLCVCAKPVWPGNKLTLTLELDGHILIQLSAVVVELVAFQRQIGMRMRFCEISSKSRIAIAKWMAAVAQDCPSA